VPYQLHCSPDAITLETADEATLELLTEELATDATDDFEDALLTTLATLLLDELVAATELEVTVPPQRLPVTAGISAVEPPLLP